MIKRNKQMYVGFHSMGLKGQILFLDLRKKSWKGLKLG